MNQEWLAHAIGQLQAMVMENRRAARETAQALNRRIDWTLIQVRSDLEMVRRELLGDIRQVEERRRSSRGRLGWLRHVPWDRLVLFTASSLGTLGWIKPEWLRWLRLLVGGTNGP